MGFIDIKNQPPFKFSVAQLHDYQTEFGELMVQINVAYETYGTLNAQGTNAILLCHALTGDAHASDDANGTGWWEPLVGPHRTIDTTRYYVICMNVLGGCSGTTGPASIKPYSDQVYGQTYPVITIRDMVHVQYRVLQQLGVKQLHAVIGGSMGGMQALEWSIMYPDIVEHAVIIAANAEFSAMGLAYNEVMRQAITSDPEYADGNYANLGKFPENGMRIARMVGMITYRTAKLFDERFGRSFSDQHLFDPEVGRYLRYQGDKFLARFDPQSYLTLLRAMDLHDIGTERGGISEAFKKIRAELLWIGIRDDLLYPPEKIRETVAKAQANGVIASFAEIDSDYGHDAFLLEFEQLEALISPFINQLYLGEQAL
ncbi:MAG: homoserine O-acetyltransferase [Acidibacillus sp.]|uniref:Homoserine O-acetyltransferase n=1 Tax=Sulfoacidibacillus ferrooxidans TaxID=2005001 RepID=A0A9X1V7S8_9BACL|nr:homoserine O-acetyltransferase [Sulfoacidibacillus ferrooxidans]MCI0183241.1 Homoserine O-acetyltransferase [Sulfoacidibacillus ferrooxidans]MCY0893772.1 homoserine O-acetyltransferase [Acidibacillus sp.]